jgi:hypothetical protein
MRVMRCDLHGGNVETLVSNGDVEYLEHRKDYLRWCVGIQVDEEAGLILLDSERAAQGWERENIEMSY